MTGAGVEVTRTSRGLAVVRGTDRYGRSWSIQDSSLATEACIWLGSDSEESGRAHLTQDDAATLIPLLQAFVQGGSIGHRLASTTSPDVAGEGGIAHLSREIAADPDHAWGVHCNLAMPILDAIGCLHQQANEAAAHLMQHLFGYDVTTDERYDYGKSGAQSYAEMRIAADREEDEEIAQVHAPPPAQGAEEVLRASTPSPAGGQGEREAVIDRLRARVEADEYLDGFHLDHSTALAILATLSTDPTIATAREAGEVAREALAIETERSSEQSTRHYVDKIRAGENCFVRAHDAIRVAVALARPRLSENEVEILMDAAGTLSRCNRPDEAEEVRKVARAVIAGTADAVSL